MSARTTKAILAVSICSMLLLFSFLAAPAAAQSQNKTYQLNLTEKIGPVEIPVSSLGLDSAALAELIGQLPEELQAQLQNVESIYLDGMVHINLKVWERSDGCKVDLQFFWHGTIALLCPCDYVILGFDAKNVQAIVHVELPSCDISQIEAFANIHLKGALLIGCGCDGVVSIDLKAHLLFGWDDGSLTMFKLWLPDLEDLEIV
ncbi:MAG: hypothetical protein LUO79_03365 [Methanomassiliicoccales archaeon]|nr:hypothetical protein [Methanomassiliicoccales archaeon]